MPALELLRHQAIARVVSQHPLPVDKAAVQLWESLSGKLVVLVGESGFLPIYSRSVYLTRLRFAWLMPQTAQTSREGCFASLKDTLHAQILLGNGEEAREASKTLFNNFSDILAGLIGETLTSGVLLAAWKIEPGLFKADLGDRR